MCIHVVWEELVLFPTSQGWASIVFYPFGGISVVGVDSDILFLLSFFLANMVKGCYFITLLGIYF